MKILLVDADSKIPNLALMKLSAYHKSKGHDVSFLALKVPYYPHRKHRHHSIPENYDVAFVSAVFDTTPQWISYGSNTVVGGTGYSLSTTLPPEVARMEPDYSIYPDNNVSYGFISRGCIRNCKFCVVPEKEGLVEQVANVDDIVRHKKTAFLDNNILALPNHRDILLELAHKRIRHKFYQGLDIRLLDLTNSRLISLLKYWGNPTFGFDDWNYINAIERGLELLNWRFKWGLHFLLYVHPDMPHENLVWRLEYMKRHQCHVTVMRDVACYSSPDSGFYIDIAGWASQPVLFRKATFKEALEARRHADNAERLDRSLSIYEQAVSKFPKIGS